MIKNNLIEQLKKAFGELENTASQFDDTRFFERSANGKWSAAENVEHLILSVKPLIGLFSNPNIMLEKWGKSNRVSESYDNVVARYLDRIGNIGPGLPAYTPKNLPSPKKELIDRLALVNADFVEKASLLTKAELDEYQIPHPVIGLLTAGEFLVFTHYHTLRHKAAMERL